jgi:hypothetical protein
MTLLPEAGIQLRVREKGKMALIERERKLSEIQGKEKKGITRDLTSSPRDLQVTYLYT